MPEVTATTPTTETKPPTPDPANIPAPPEEKPEFTKSQVKAMFDAEMKRREDEAKAVAEKAKLASELEQAKKDNDWKAAFAKLESQQKASDERAAAAEKQAAKLQRDIRIERIGAKHKLTELIADGTLTPQGDSESDLDAWAEKTAKRIGAGTTPPTSTPPGPQSRGAPVNGEAKEQWDRALVAARNSGLGV